MCKALVSILLCVLASVNGIEMFFKGTPKVNPGSLYQYTNNPFEDNYGAYLPSVMDYGSSHREMHFGQNVLTQVRMQSAIIAEKYLRSSKDLKCTQRNFCNVAVHSNSNDDARATLSSVNILNQMLNEVTGHTKKFPHITGLVAAFSVGSQTRNTTICKWLFSCPQDFTQNEGRINCKTASKLCPGISISCAVCAMVAPDTCGAVCPIAALYCGTSGYACMNRGSEEKEKPEAEEIETEIPGEGDTEENEGLKKM